MTAAPSDSGVLVDGHVHLHGCFPVEEFLTAAARNFHRARQRLGLFDDAPGVLLLADLGGQDSVELVRSWAMDAAGTWRLETTGEKVSGVVCGREAAPLVLIAGRQVATGDGLEVLALGTRARLPDGEPLAETLAAARGGGAPAVVPWGFGKWWFRRRRLVEDILPAVDPDLFFLGDNGGRPRWAPPPAMFRKAAELGIRVLAGSDPLPFASHRARAGSYGFVLQGRFDLERPAASLKSLLKEQPGQPRTYGERRPIGSFCRDQIAMQRRKRNAIGTPE